MTPEELEEIRSTLEFASQAGAKDEFMDTTFNLLEFIDEQAAQIETLKEDIEVMKLGEKAADGLILQGRKYAEQIEALKEKLVEEVAWSHFNEERLGARQDVSFSDVAEEYRRKARQQLKANPDLQKAGVEWE